MAGETKPVAKSGWKTTEFGMPYLMQILVGAFGLQSDSEMVRASALIAIGLIGLGFGIGYPKSRAVAKAADAHTGGGGA